MLKDFLVVKLDDPILEARMVAEKTDKIQYPYRTTKEIDVVGGGKRTVTDKRSYKRQDFTKIGEADKTDLRTEKMSDKLHNQKIIEDVKVVKDTKEVSDGRI